MRTAIAIIFLLSLGCNHQTPYTTSISSFRPELRRLLTQMINSGTAHSEVSWNLKELATVDELRQLTLSEHPILRLDALIALMRIDSIDKFALLMSHLDDTAYVTYYQVGCWARLPYRQTTVTDEIIHGFSWESVDDRQRTIDKVLFNHNYINAAYTVLPYIETKEKYYRIVKEMASRDRSYSLIENALYALAKYNRREDIAFIKDKMQKNMHHLEYLTFEMITQHPHQSFFPILQEFADKEFEYRVCNATQKNLDQKGLFPILLLR